MSVSSSDPTRVGGGLSWAERLGIFGRGDARTVLILLLASLAIYTISFLAFYPEIATNDDEAMYQRQAQLVLRGASTVAQINPLTGVSVETSPSTYGPGTAYMLAPFVAAFGVRGAYLVPLLGVILAVLLTARWIRDAGYSPFFALLVLGFPPLLVMGRITMSDVPSAALCALGLWFFWRGQDRSPGWWLAAGFIAGASIVMRVSNPLLFVPLFVGTVLRREWKCWALVVGGLAGLAFRALAMATYFGDALFERAVYLYEPETIGERLPLYLLALMVFVPGGLVFSLLYRGERRFEIVSTVLLFFSFYLFQRYYTYATSFEKQIVLANRYLIPLVPLMAFAMSETVPRLFSTWRDRCSEQGARRLVATTSALTLLYVGVVGCAAAAVHPTFFEWSKTQAELRREISAVLPGDRVFVTNWMATRKFVSVLDQKFTEVRRNQITASDVESLIDEWGEIYIVLLRRTDSEFWRAEAQEAEEWLVALEREPTPVLDKIVSPTMHLRIWTLEASSHPR